MQPSRAIKRQFSDDHISPRDVDASLPPPLLVPARRGCLPPRWKIVFDANSTRAALRQISALLGPRTTWPRWPLAGVSGVHSSSEIRSRPPPDRRGAVDASPSARHPHVSREGRLARARDGRDRAIKVDQFGVFRRVRSPSRHLIIADSGRVEAQEVWGGDDFFIVHPAPLYRRAMRTRVCVYGVRGRLFSGSPVDKIVLAPARKDCASRSRTSEL